MNEDPVLPEDDEPVYELTPEQATSLDSGSDSPGVFNRKKVLILVCCVLAGTVAIGVISNTLKSSKKSKTAVDDEYAQSRSNAAFVNNLRDTGLRNAASVNIDPALLEDVSYLPEDNKEPVLPPVSYNRQYEPAQPQQYSSGGGQQQRNTFYESPLVPRMQGSLFSQGNTTGGGSGAQNYQSNIYGSQYDDYLNGLNARAASYGGLAQEQGNTPQNNNQDFYQSTNSPAAVYEGQFLGEDSLWMGTIIPGVLETAINTSLPGQVLARVTQNIYDSKTGRFLLIPQGSILLARYNSSVSYAQSRVQIIWDVLIRPDGYQIYLEGANGVDKAGMSGVEADYKGNFFEYVKAAGIISLFSIANAKLTETVNKFGANNETTAANLAESNAQFFNQLGSGLVSQAMNVQPVLTVENGALINIMLNKTIYLPRVPAYTPNQKYILE